MKTLKQLLEDAHKSIENEDGTVGDLGLVPTGHKPNQKVDIENISDEDELGDIG